MKRVCGGVQRRSERREADVGALTAGEEQRSQDGVGWMCALSTRAAVVAARPACWLVCSQILVTSSSRPGGHDQRRILLMR